LETKKIKERRTNLLSCSPFGGIPRNWKQPSSAMEAWRLLVPPSGGSLEIGNVNTGSISCIVTSCSPFGGIPRNWKPRILLVPDLHRDNPVPPSGGSLEIGNKEVADHRFDEPIVPPSGGSLEIGNFTAINIPGLHHSCSPFGGIPRNWKLTIHLPHLVGSSRKFPLRGDP